MFHSFVNRDVANHCRRITDTSRSRCLLLQDRTSWILFRNESERDWSFSGRCFSILQLVGAGYCYGRVHGTIPVSVWVSWFRCVGPFMTTKSIIDYKTHLWVRIPGLISSCRGLHVLRSNKSTFTKEILVVLFLSISFRKYLVSTTMKQLLC